VKTKLIVAGIIVISVGIWAFSSFRSSLSAYVSIAEAQQRGTRVQVMGEIDHNNVKYDLELKTLNFSIMDDRGDIMNVSYDGIMPGNFDQATHVVCIGSYDGNKFITDQLLIKCPSKYQGEER